MGLPFLVVVSAGSFISTLFYTLRNSLPWYFLSVIDYRINLFCSSTARALITCYNSFSPRIFYKHLFVISSLDGYCFNSCTTVPTRNNMLIKMVSTWILRSAIKTYNNFFCYCVMMNSFIFSWMIYCFCLFNPRVSMSRSTVTT